MKIEFDNAIAMKEGWAITTGHDVDLFRLEKLDEADVFESDQKAWAFVYELAVRGSYYHNSALEFLAEHSPNEFQRVIDEVLAKDEE
jgi:hypothetical protein